MVNKDIYSEKFVETLFNRMSETYGVANYISSFGFTERWRKHCVAEINWDDNTKVGYDLMSGMGEAWGIILNHADVKITGVDISPNMNKQASEKLKKNEHWNVEIREENILKSKIPSHSADFIISTFGLKTFSPGQLEILAKEIIRILKVGGQFSMIEISVPNNYFLKIPYLFYLRFIIPFIGRIFMRNSFDYKMLGVYCQKFKNCHAFKRQLETAGLQVSVKEYFFGCATGVVGYKS